MGVGCADVGADRGSGGGRTLGGPCRSGWRVRREGGVLVSGPDGVNRDVQNACVGLVGEGRRVRVCVEKFGW